MAADDRLSRALLRTAPDGFTQRLSDFGNIPVAVPVLLLAIVYAVQRGNRPGAAAAALAMAAVPALIVPLKEWTGRPGPLEPWATGYYPSGHTATSYVAYTASALLVTPYLRRDWPHALAAAVTALTAAGLIVRGYHWPLDVLASLLLFTPLLLGVNAVIRRHSPWPGPGR
ncbi:phosphatase PAP2 family protein [Streptomyces sp. NPDC054956]